MKTQIVLLLACTLVTSAKGQTKPPTKTQKKIAVPLWTPDKSLLKQLDKATTVEGYSLQPPQGYEPVHKDQPSSLKGSVKLYGWLGKAREDGTHPTVLLGIIVPPVEERKKITLEQLTLKLLEGVKRMRTDWQQAKTETGLIHGMTFARIRWTGTEPNLKRKMQGVIYVARDGETILQMTSQDVLPEAKQALPLAEASIMTFKK